MSRPEVGSELHEMDVVQTVNGLELQNDLPGDHEVDAGSPNRYTLEGNVDWKLRLEGYGPMRERNPYGIVIHRFDKARPQLSVYGERGPDHLTGKFLKSKHLKPYKFLPCFRLLPCFRDSKIPNTAEYLRSFLRPRCQTNAGPQPSSVVQPVPRFTIEDMDPGGRQPELAVAGGKRDW